ncbi:MAG: 2-amino-3,7-dideoxy-D-threo-hept-6-ulosonate synthase [Candidatus Brocadiia bacterium]
MIGKTIRLERIIDRNSRRTVIVPMDHGITLGPIRGLEDMRTTVERIVAGGANAIIEHKGIVVSGHRGSGRDIGLIVHLSASTSLSPDPDSKVAVTEVEEAIRIGADGVSVHVNLGASTEMEMLRNLGRTARKCSDWGIPLLAMMYTRGEKIQNPFDVKYVKHAARVGAELGADVVKVVYTGAVESFREVVAGCPVPVLIAGGEKMESDEELLTVVAGALKAGCAGVSIGRNVFQHRNPMRMIEAISALVHRNKGVADGLRILKKRQS